MLLVAVKFAGHTHNGAKRWIGHEPFVMQPSEMAKIALVLFLAGIMARRKTLARRLSCSWLPPMMIVGAMAGLVFIEPDMGTAIALLGTALVMLYAGGVMKRTCSDWYPAWRGSPLPLSRSSRIEWREFGSG